MWRANAVFGEVDSTKATDPPRFNKVRGGLTHGLQVAVAPSKEDCETEAGFDDCGEEKRYANRSS